MAAIGVLFQERHGHGLGGIGLLGKDWWVP